MYELLALNVPVTTKHCSNKFTASLCPYNLIAIFFFKQTIGESFLRKAIYYISGYMNDSHIFCQLQKCRDIFFSLKYKHPYVFLYSEDSLKFWVVRSAGDMQLINRYWSNRRVILCVIFQWQVWWQCYISRIKRIVCKDKNWLQRFYS